MKKRTRTVLFWLAVIIFGVASYVAILYAQGYKYDFGHHAFLRTGGISVTVNTDATLAIDGKSAGAMAFLSHRAGANRILPGTHAIAVTKQGYSSWAKTAVVQEGLLTDFPHVLLVPLDPASSASLRAEIVTSLATSHTLADAGVVSSPSLSPSRSPRPRTTPRATPIPTPTQVVSGNVLLRNDVLYQVIDQQETPIADQVLGFSVAPDTSRVLWWTRTEVWVLWFNNTDYQPYRTANQREVITRFADPINRAGWFRDNDHIVVDLGLTGYRILETDTRGGLNIIKI